MDGKSGFQSGVANRTELKRAAGIHYLQLPMLQIAELVEDGSLKRVVRIEQSLTRPGVYPAFLTPGGGN